jgi:hypothetical protein
MSIDERRELKAAMDSRPSDVTTWADWGGPVPTVAEVVTGEQVVAVTEAVMRLVNGSVEGRRGEVDIGAALRRAWTYVLNHGVYCLRCDAGDGEGQDEWILFGEDRP